MDDEIAIGGGQSPIYSRWRTRFHAGQPICGLAEFHHQGISGFLKQLVFEIIVFPSGDDFIDTFEPRFDVKQFLSNSAIHHSDTASRRMSSSTPGFRPP